MNDSGKVLIVDAGNTSIKAGLIASNELVDVRRFSMDALESLAEWCEELGEIPSAFSSVLSPEDTERLISVLPKPIQITAKSVLPVYLNYDSIDTLGIDRICNAAYAFTQLNSEYAVVIDIGTCLKFDLVHRSKGYLGGSIAPGVDLRYKSLNDYTGNLPRLSNKTTIGLVGMDTEGSIRSGVMNGMKAEISQLMTQYSEQFGDLTFFVTGGDGAFFDIHSKNDIFADENLTLKGLFEIYKHNA